MILLLEEINIFDIKSNFSILVENHLLGNTEIDSTDFIETKFKKEGQFDYSIIKKLDEKFNSALKLKQVNDYKNIYSITWHNKNLLTEDFSTYIYLEDRDTFLKEKRHYEKQLNVNLINLRKATIEEVIDSKFDNILEAVLEIITKQNKIKTPSIIYYIFEDVLGEEKMRTLRRMSFI